MDQFLSMVGIQAMKFAVRSGVALTSQYAMDQCSQLVKKVDDKKLEKELRSLQQLLDGKIKVRTHDGAVFACSNIGRPSLQLSIS